MRCPNCGTENPEEARFCGSCGHRLVAEAGPPGAAGPAAVPQPATTVGAVAGPAVPPVERAYQRFVGFWRRFVAWMVDVAVLTVIFVVLSQALAVPLRLYWVYGSFVYHMLSLVVIWGYNVAFIPLALSVLLWTRVGLYYYDYAPSEYLGLLLPWVTIWVYNVAFVAPRGQTLGKMLLRLRVVTRDGAVPGLGRAALREVLGKLLSGIVLGLGVLGVAWDGKKRGWHDHVAGTYVVYEEDYRKNRPPLAR